MKTESPSYSAEQNLGPSKDLKPLRFLFLFESICTRIRIIPPLISFKQQVKHLVLKFSLMYVYKHSRAGVIYSYSLMEYCNNATGNYV